MSGTEDPKAPTADATSEAGGAPAYGYQPKPPLWQPPAPPPRKRSETVILVLAVAMIAAIVMVMGEKIVLTTPATETPLTITRLESTDPADEHHAAKFRYQVRLPDGSSARFASSSLYAAGTRLKAMVSRGRITHRVVVSGPYVALPAE